ncbi:MAG: APC family permease [Armatimonadetes bacterium]|nr:APC family permease [Armatimonadota bacterium]
MSTYQRIKQFLIGRPIATKYAHGERLNVPFGLAVFASDAMSSVAYATEEVLLVLILAGSIAAYGKLLPISLALILLMVIIAFSYRQTIYAYPNNGGTYVVSKDNLGPVAGQVAGAALLIDYVLTVAVSIAAGVQAIVSINNDVQPYAVPIACAAILFLGIMNMRGAKESGLVFAIPTYGFVLFVFILIIKAILMGWHEHITPNLPPADMSHSLGAFLILRGFAASCTALTGTEAIANGVSAFKEPEARNASRALIGMVTLLGIMFFGLSWAAWHNGIVPMNSEAEGYRTVLAQIAAMEFGADSIFYKATLMMTAGILFLAANTAFADFPRLASFIAKDGYLPRQLSSLGDRLVFQNGILLLAFVSMGIIITFKADTHLLIPLYALGVFVGFTLSQFGMAVHFGKIKFINNTRFAKDKVEGEPVNVAAHSKAIRKLNLQQIVSIFGGLCTTVVAGILLVTKWSEKAYLVVFAMIGLIGIFQLINSYYKRLGKALTVTPTDVITTDAHMTTILLIPRLHRGVLQAISYAQKATPDCQAVHVSLDPEHAKNLKSEWVRLGIAMPLVVLDSPYRSVIEPIGRYVDELLQTKKNMMVTVIVPQAVTKKWWLQWLHGNAAIGLKAMLGSRRNVIITNIRYLTDAESQPQMADSPKAESTSPLEETD